MLGRAGSRWHVDPFARLWMLAGLAMRFILAVVVSLPGIGCRASVPVVAPPVPFAETLAGLVLVPAPPGVEPGHVEPRAGDDLAAARRALADIVDGLPRPPYLVGRDRARQGASDAGATQRDPGGSVAAGMSSTERSVGDGGGRAAASAAEPPLAVQRYYARGRLAFMAGDNFEAIEHLQHAHALAPDSAAIVRLLGNVHARSNPVKARGYLQQTVRLDPDDMESLFMLGRDAMGRAAWAESICTLDAALAAEGRAADVDPSLSALTHFVLGTVLHRAGHDRAAIEQWRLYLDVPRRVVGSTRFARERYLLQRQSHVIWQQVGDAHHRLGEPEAALAAYESALATPTATLHALCSRLVYTHLRLGSPAEARMVLLADLRSGGADDQTARLIAYLAEHAGDRAELAAQLTTLYEEGGRSADMAMMIAAVLEADEAVTLLCEHLRAKPADSAVFRDVTRRLLADSGDAPAPERAAEVMRVLADVVASLPAAAERYGTLVLDAATDPAVLLEGIERLDDARRRRAVVRFVRGVLLARAGGSEAALAELASVRSARPDLVAAHVEAARILVEQGRLEEAGAILAGLDDSDDARVLLLHVEVLARTGSQDEAVALLDRLIRKHPKHEGLVLHKARLQLVAGRGQDAEQTLLRFLDQAPKAEAVYEMLFQIYDLSDVVPESTHQYEKLLRRAQEAIPESWVARLKLAELKIYRSDALVQSQAETTLRALMSERPEDHRALDALLELLWRTQRRDEANALIDGLLAADAADRALLEVALQHYRDRVKDGDRVYDLAERLLLAQPAGEGRDLELGRLYLRMGRPAEAVKVLSGHVKPGAADPVALLSYLMRALEGAGQPAEAERRLQAGIELFAEHRAELRLELAMLYVRRGDDAGAERIMLGSLRDSPDHADTNNSLGYTWADRGIHLARALSMIQKAVEAKPGNPAFRDSLGWVYYKLGRFPDAVRELKRARAERGGQNAIILDHLGDAQYRAGAFEDAVRTWGEALGRFRPEEAKHDPEMKGLGERLRLKIEAHKQSRQPELADVPGAAEPQVESERPARKPAPPGPEARRASPGGRRASCS